MTTTLTRPAWTTDYELEIFNRLIEKHAPHIPRTRLHDPRPPATPEELENFYRFRIAGAAHDLYIVQVCARAIDQLISDPDVQLFLSRQIGDDGAHAEATRRRVQALSGRDPIEEIQQQIQKHWDYMGDIPHRNWLGFIAFELHYELHIVAHLLVNSRTTEINDPETGSFAAERILPDEAVHRLGVVDWWQRKYNRASPGEKAELAAQLLELDEEVQRRRNAYLKEHWQVNYNATRSQIEGLDSIYDAWRREVLSYFLEIPISQLPKLVSVNE